MKIGIIGMGRVGTALLEALAEVPLVEVTSVKTNSHNKQVNYGLLQNVSIDEDYLTVLEKSDVLFLTVPDDKIVKVAEKLASELLYSGKKLALQEKYCFHCSGSLGLEVLAPLNALGLNIGSMHPLQSFSGLKASFQNIGIAIDGSSNVLKVSKMLASALGAKPFNVPATERASYHAAACICSNYLVTIVALAQELVSKWTMDKKVALEVLLPLIDGTVTNLHQVDQAALALSGPIARGDVATVKAHLKVLPADLKKTYCVLGEQTVKIARSAGTIDSKTAEQLLEVLQR